MTDTTSDKASHSTLQAISSTPVAGYAGDVSCAEAHRATAADPDARIIDVRTKAEWTFVGVPEIADAERAAFLEWQAFPGGAPNPDFLSELTRIARPSAPVFFLCRSGARSASAARAATEAGYALAFNIADGFEGPCDDDGHRGRLSGWKAEGLPWRQS